MSRLPMFRLLPASIILLVGALLVPTLSAQSLLIDEFRLRGPSGANDEYISLVNNSNTAHTVAASSGTGYAIVASDGTARCVVPNGTVIPAGGHYLCVNSVAYSLASYPAGNGTTATGDATFTTDIPDNAGIALFNTSVSANFTLANRLDAVGSTSEANTLYKEGTGYPALTPFSINYAFYRDRCGKAGSITNDGPCTAAGLPVDTNNNAADFVFVDTNGTSAGAGQRLGSPGPRNLSSPIFASASISGALLDACATASAAPNRVRNNTSDPANNSTFGTLDIRAAFTNHTGGNLTALRFRIVDLTTFPAPSNYADLRPRTSTDLVVAVDNGAPCGGSGTSNVTAFGTTLEQPPSQPNGGGFNSSLRVPGITLATPLADGASVDVRFLLGIQQTGHFRFAIIPEGLPDGGNAIYTITGNTEGVAPSVTSITRGSSSPVPPGSIVTYDVTFDQSVTGVDASDFALTTTGSVAGATITGVTGSGANYTVTVNTGSGSGTLRLDLIDDDSIKNSSNIPLGDIGTGNGDYTSGEVYTIATTPPNVTSITRADSDPVASGATVHYTVNFSQAVTGVDATDFALTTTGSIAGATITGVSGSGTTYIVTVNTGTGTGTVRLDVVDDDSIINATSDPLGGPGAGNGNFTSGEVYTVSAAPTVTSITYAGSNPTPAGSPLTFTVTFSQPVTGVDATDFALTTTGSISGASITGVSGSGTTYTVTVNSGTGSGTIRLDLIDNDSIVNGSSIPLGGPGAGNGNFTSGSVVTLALAVSTNVPALSPEALALLGCLLAAAALLVMKRS